jgi:hypothetical protein
MPIVIVIIWTDDMRDWIAAKKRYRTQYSATPV